MRFGFLTVATMKYIFLGISCSLVGIYLRFGGNLLPTFSG
jgi:hypothetical protein